MSDFGITPCMARLLTLRTEAEDIGLTRRQANRLVGDIVVRECEEMLADSYRQLGAAMGEAAAAFGRLALAHGNLDAAVEHEEAGGDPAFLASLGIAPDA